jgi:hypothetical protein
MSEFWEYLKNGGDEAARARAEAEYTAGHLGLALDEAQELRAENERLRAALKPFADYAEHFEKIFGDTHSDGDTAIPIGGRKPHRGVTRGMCKAARAALSLNDTGDK